MQQIAKRFVEGIDNRLNPLLLRELRQLVRNRFIIVLINLFLLIQVFCCMMTVLFESPSNLHGSGHTLFAWLLSIMGLTCFLAVVLYSAVTTANERIGDDLMFTSALKPGSIVFGKWLAGAVLTILLMSITAPFVTLAYLLRGLDIEIVAVSFVNTFVTIQFLNALGICLFSHVKTRVQMSALLAGSFFVVLFAAASGFHVLFSGTFFIHWMNWRLFLLTQAAFLVLFLLVAAATIAPSTSNRMLPVRIMLTVIFFGSLGISYAMENRWGVSDAIGAWLYGWTAAAAVLVLLAVSERETWSFRIRQSVPKNILLRIFCFPFFTGSPCGLVWLALLAAVVMTVENSWTGSYAFDHVVSYWLLFSADYCVTALLIRSWFAPRSVTPDKTWTIVLFLVLTFTMGSLLVFFLCYSSSVVYGDFDIQYSRNGLSALNPFVLNSDHGNIELQSMAAGIWLIALIPFFLLWFFLRVRFFSPFGSDRAMTLQQAEQAIRHADANPLVKGVREQAIQASSDSL